MDIRITTLLASPNLSDMALMRLRRASSKRTGMGFESGVFLYFIMRRYAA